MRIDSQSLSIDKVTSMRNVGNADIQAVNQSNVEDVSTVPTENSEELPIDKLKKAVDSVNDFLKVNNSELKFVYHEELDKYYVQLVDSDTKEVVKEIPPKKLLDVYYEMQKLAGMIIDEKI